MKKFFHSKYWIVAVLALFVSAVFDQSYVGRKELVIHLRASCNGGISDRQDTIKVRTRQAMADDLVASDPKQPARTRKARRDEALAEWASVDHLKTRIPPVFTCERAIPFPSPWPHF